METTWESCQYKDIDGTIKSFKCQFEYAHAMCQSINRYGDFISSPIESLNFILGYKNIDFLKPYNFIKILECINISDFSRCSIFHARLGSDDFSKCQRYFIGDLCKELCFNITPKNNEVEESYKRYKESRKKILELLLKVEWE